MSDTSGTIEVHAALSPFKQERVDLTVTAGLTIAEIMEAANADPILVRHAHVYVGPHYIPRENWHRVRPRAGMMVSVRAFIAPQGGDSGAGKNVLRSVLLIAVAAAALAFAPYLAGALVPGLGALGVSAAQAVIGIGGMLLVNTLVPPRTASTAASDKDSQTKFIEGAQNRAAPFEVVPVIFGTRRIKPNDAALPYTEIVGDNQYLRLLFIYGIGPLDLADFRIGETALSDFDDVQVEHFYGYPTDTAPTLFATIVDQQDFSITLNQSDGYTVRTTSDGADEISVDIVFPEGLIEIDTTDGSRQSRTVSVTIQYSVAGANNWQRIPIANGTKTFSTKWTNTDGTSFDQINFTQKKTAAIRHGLTWRVPASGTYDVRIKRNTADNTADNIRDTVVWASLRKITRKNPVNSPVPVAMTALRIRATDQLNGVINEFSALATMIAKDWTGSAWVTRKTNNPAAAFRQALQSPALQNPKTDTQIDLVGLAAWSDYCNTQGFHFNQVRDFPSSLWDLLQDIAAAGRASPTLLDGKYSVVIDQPKTPVSHVTPRNSSNFNVTKAFIDPPHAFRVQFENEDQDYKNDEVRVYLNGYNATTATLFETIEFPGVTNSDENVEHARYYAACAIQRPEQWTYNQEMEHLTYRRGDVIYITHDVLIVGISQGRIKSLTVDSSGNVLGFVSDTPLPMNLSQIFGVAIRTATGGSLVAQLTPADGDQTVLVFVTPILAANSPAVGNLFGFGISGSITDKALILSVEPSNDFNALITATPYREAVYDNSIAIPPFDSNLSPLPDVPDVVITNVRSDETVLTVGPGNSLLLHVAVKVQSLVNMTGVLEVQSRPSITDEPFTAAQIDQQSANEVFIGDVRTDEDIDIRLRWRIDGKQPGNWTYFYNHHVVGKSTPPNPLINLTLSPSGGQALIRWDQPNELDVQFGGTVQFRHSEQPLPTWANSISIGDVAQARSLVATLPLKGGTYLARVFDSSGYSSSVVSVTAKQSSVFTFNPVLQIDEQPSFSGTKTNVIVDTISGVPTLYLDSSGSFDAIADLDNLDGPVDAYGGTTASLGYYVFANALDFGVVSKVRLTTYLQTYNALVTDLIDNWSDEIDLREDWDGNDSALCDCVIYVSMTDTDPSGTPTWTAWQRLEASEIEARACKFMAVLSSKTPDYNIFINQITVKAEAI